MNPSIARTTLLVFTAIMSRPLISDAQRIQPSVRVDSLQHGIYLHKPVRFTVSDVMVGRRSILDLLKPVRQAPPRNGPYYRNEWDSVSLALNRWSKVTLLRDIIKQENTNRIRIILQDRKTSILRSIYEIGQPIFPRYSFEQQMQITVRDLPVVCSTVTEIVSRSMNDVLREPLERSARTGASVSLDSLFQLLLVDKLDGFIEELGNQQANAECLRTLEFLKWVRGNNAEGFVRGEYRITRGVRDGLDALAMAQYCPAITRRAATGCIRPTRHFGTLYS